MNYGIVSTAPGVFDGSHMLSLTTDGVNPFTLSTHSEDGLDEGRFYTFSIYVATDTGTETLNFKATAYNDEDEQILDGNGNSYTNTITADASPDWKRFSVSVYVPETAESVYLKVEVNTGTNVSSGNKLYFDAAQVEQGYSPTDYFDGSYTEIGAYWTGTTDDSVSVLFRNKTVKMDRLVHEIADYLPLNTAWTVVSGVLNAYTLEASGFSS